MDSPVKADYREADEAQKPQEGLELPPEIYEDMKKNETFLFYAFMFLNGSVLWAYYSCLSAQDYYQIKYPHVDFPFLTIMCKAWPMFMGHLIQMTFNIDKYLTTTQRVYIGYGMFMLMGVIIMIISAIDFGESNLGGYLVLVCFGFVGLSDSVAEPTGYALAALFPVEKFTTGVQIGNTVAGALNVALQTLIRLMVGGIHQTSDSSTQAFFIFFSMLLVVCVIAMYMYQRVLRVPCVDYLVKRNNEHNASANVQERRVPETLSNYARIFQMIWVPCLAQFLVFFVSLSVFPGFGISAGLTAYNEVQPPYPKLSSGNPDWPTSHAWYISPGIIGSYSFGDLFGRVMCVPCIYKIFTMPLALSLTVIRIGYIVLLLMGCYGTSMYVFGDMTHDKLTVVLIYEIVITFTVGLSNGLLSTVTMGRAPRMVPISDREQAGLIMVAFLFFGIASGATFGFLTKDNHWFGLQ